MEAKYYLPFDTSEHPIRISQGNNGPWSHYLLKRELADGTFAETDLIHAVDFALPLGSEVRAMRSGTVLGVLLGGTWYYEGVDPEIGNNPEGYTNHLAITHEDGTWALYAHLANEALVRRNQIVAAGDIIAKTGRSGWIADTPHVHIQVMGKGLKRTIPIAFLDYKGSLDHETLAKEGKIWLG